MPVFQQQGLIFIHIPKTGGESIADALVKAIGTDSGNHRRHGTGLLGRWRAGRKPDLVHRGKHATAMQLREILGQRAYDSAFKFSIVRNPWDQVVSFYHHLRKPLHVESLHGKLLKPHNACRLALGTGFPEWVEEVYLKRQPQEEAGRKRFPVDHFSNQSDWLLDPSGAMLVDFVCRFEKLQQDLAIVEQKAALRFAANLPHHNRSRHGHYSEYYDDRSRNIVAMHFKKDIELFGYTFEAAVRGEHRQAGN
jgi:hypothetical protein